MKIKGRSMMTSQWKRLAWAALLSCSCFAATLIWYKSTENSGGRSSGEAPLAQAGKVGEDVIKRPATRLLWQTVNTGDYLYNGEMIRTSSRSEIRIQFDDGRYIDLEPDSTVVLQKSQGEIALDLMDGSVFVNAKNEGAGGPGLVLNSANGKVDLSGASASLSKGKGGVDLQVLEGSATIKDKDGKTKEVSAGATLGSNLNIEVISPTVQKPFYIDPDAENPVPFKWKGAPSQYKIAIMAGLSRKELREWAVTDKAGVAELFTKFPIGKYYWKLEARDPATGKAVGETSIYRTEFVARYAPTVVFPTANAEIPAEKLPASVQFKWQKGEEATKVVLEVGTEKNLKNKLAYKSFETEETFTLENVKEGEYYWRMSAFYPGSDKPTMGQVQTFRILKLAKKEPIRIGWTIPENKLTQFFYNEPSLELTWKPENRAEEIASFRLQLVEEKGSPEDALKFQSKDLQYKAAVPRAGRYIASVEAYDKEGNMLGRSDTRTVAAVAYPLLPPPKILPEEGILQSQNDGRSEIKWEALDGAKEYLLVIANKDGKELAKRNYQGTTTNLKNLLPGEYKIKLIAVDQQGRQGQEGPTRTLVVPDKSNIKAPKLKKIKVN
jgi:hypothetical protein